MTTSDPLLNTKIAVPPLQRHVVRREHLLARLTAGLRCRLTLVSAPAGFGKTTLVGAWVAEISHSREDLAVAWLSLDQGERDLTRFLTYLLAAVSRAVPELSAALPTVGTPGVPWRPEAVASQVINAVDTWPGELVLVLDDYHVISGDDVHDFLTFVLDHLPANFHIVILTRADPPLPLSRLRGRGQLTELRISDLRFSEAEAVAFLRDVMGIALSAEDVARLTRRTEGWVVGLQMAALSMRGRDDITSFVELFTGSHRYVMDYLLEEVLERQPDEVQDFMLCTSILDTMTAPLCDAVWGAEGRAQEMLTTLERQNLFIVPLDTRRVWFRYHHLFSDLLRQRLLRFPLVRIRDLHRRAGQWYEAHGMVDAAIDHALAVHDDDRAAALIGAAAEVTLARSELTTFTGWIDALPQAVLDRHPDLALYITWTQFWQGRAHHEIEADLDRLNIASDTDAGRVAVLRALFALYRGETTSAIRWARSGLAQLREEDVLFRGLSSVLQVLQRVEEGDPRSFQAELSALARESAARGNVLAAAMALNTLAEMLVRRGYLERADDVYAQALTLACDDQGRRLPIAGQTLIGLATVAWFCGETARAERLLAEGIPLARQAGEMVTLDGLLLLAQIRQAAGGMAAARELLERAWGLATRADTADLDVRIVAIERVRHWLATGDLSRAQRWVEAQGLLPPDFSLGDSSPAEGSAPPSDSVARLRKYEALMAAMVLSAVGRDRDALAALEGCVPRFEARRRPLILADALVLRCQVATRLGRAAEAATALARALALSAPRGYRRPFLDADPQTIAQLRDAAVRDVAPAFVADLLARLGEAPSTAGPGLQATAELLEALTEREFDVLRLLPTHLSSTEIAERLVVSPNTVRTHIKNVYGKLAVHSRDEAVQRARELGLL